jgi:MFS superfamily sulfate permease-like transporter
VVDKLMEQNIYKFILITENVLNFHSSDKEYYEEWFEQTNDNNGWIVALNMPEATQYDFRKKKLNYFIELIELDNWRVYKPYHLFKKIDNELSKRITL